MTGLEVAVRFIHLASVLLLVGSFSFELLVGRPSLRTAGANAPIFFQSFYRLQFRVTRWSVLLAIVTGVLGLLIKIAAATGSASSESFAVGTVMNFVTGTRFGTIWIVRMALLSLILAVLLGWPKSASTRLRIGQLFLSTALLVSMAAAGHAAAAEGTALFIQLAMDGLHLLAAGVWLGGLLPLAIFLRLAKTMREPWIFAVVQEATDRFSRLGLVSVIVLLITGLFNAWYLIGGIPPLVGTDYGYLLLAKLGILIPLLGLAAKNRWRLKPRLNNLAAHDFDKTPRLLNELQRSVIAEVSLGAAILLIVAMMGITPPAKHVQPDWPFSFRLDWNNLGSSSDIRFVFNAGGLLSIAGILLLVYVILTRPHRRWIAAAGGVLILVGGLISANALSVDAYRTTYLRPSVAYNAISVANGIILYGESCVVCHGVAGYGDGPGAADLKPKPADLTARHAATHTVGDLYWWLSHGVKNTAMPGYKESLNEDERWDLINFLRALSNAEKARSLAPVSDRDAWLVAPDFAYGTHRGETKTLKDHRGNKIVLLVLASMPESKARLAQLDEMSARLASAGVEIILVPSDADGHTRAVENSVTRLPLVIEGRDEIFKTYSLFSHSLEVDRNSPEALVSKHTEFLIDKRGYIRARWIPREGNAWLKLDHLLQEVELLQNEKSQVPAPDDHVH